MTPKLTATIAGVALIIAAAAVPVAATALGDPGIVGEGATGSAAPSKSATDKGDGSQPTDEEIARLAAVLNVDNSTAARVLSDLQAVAAEHSGLSSGDPALDPIASSIGTSADELYNDLRKWKASAPVEPGPSK